MSTALAAGVAPGVLTLDELATMVGDGRIDTVALAVVDMQGRLQGKRIAGRHFVDEIATGGAEACNYLLAVDVEMRTVEGYALTSWASGYGDFELRPDLGTLRLLPWQPRTALCLADLHRRGGAPVEESPRQVLRRQLDRLAERGLTANLATELEFIVFRNTYEEAWREDYRHLTPASLYNIDYSLLGTGRLEPLIGRIRREMGAMGLRVEDSKGECNLGQHEINFRYGPALARADEHAIYKLGAKEIAAQEGMALTFMAKWDEREGSSCHIHLSLAARDGSPVFASDPGTFSSVVAGQLACMHELTLLLAPNVNSYKRFSTGSFAPTSVAWGEDNRTCAIRAVGAGPSRRLEHRLPGADVNPYLAAAAIIAAGLHGIDEGLAAPPALEGNAYDSEAEQVPATLAEARDRFLASRMARDAFGDDVVDHYANAARVELDAFNAAVTDWERRRCFERL